MTRRTTPSSSTAPIEYTVHGDDHRSVASEPADGNDSDDNSDATSTSSDIEHDSASAPPTWMDDGEDNEDDDNEFVAESAEAAALTQSDEEYYAQQRQQFHAQRAARLAAHEWPMDSSVPVLRHGFTRLGEFLHHHRSLPSAARPASEPRQIPTHTRIGVRVPGAKRSSGGAFYIPRPDLRRFYHLYYDHVFVKNRDEQLTERQCITHEPADLAGYGPLAIDLDFQFSMQQHGMVRHFGPDDVRRIRQVYLRRLQELYKFRESDTFEIFVMQRDEPYISPKNADLVKDGLHIIMGLQVPASIQILLRHRVMRDLVDELQHLPLMHGVSFESMDKVVDDSIASGKTNWMLYGSTKPDCEPYKLTEHWVVQFTSNSAQRAGRFEEQLMRLDTVPSFELFCRMSVQYPDFPAFPVRRSVAERLDELLAAARPLGGTRGGRAGARPPPGPGAGGALVRVPTGRLPFRGDDADDVPAPPADEREWFDDDAPDDEIRPEVLEEELGDILDTYGNLRYELVTDADTAQLVVQYVRAKYLRDNPRLMDAFMFASILPPKYYEPGSHEQNRRVAFALKNTSDHLFMAWVMLRAKAEDFTWTSMPALWDEWQRMRHTNTVGRSLTDKSIHFWARTEAPDAYNVLYKKSMRLLLRKVLRNAGNQVNDHDMADLVYSVVQNHVRHSENSWYVLEKGRWMEETDKCGKTIVNMITTKVYDFFAECIGNLNEHIVTTDAEQAPDDRRAVQHMAKRTIQFRNQLRNTKSLSNIMTALRSKYADPRDKDLHKKFDANKQLLGCENGVLDFQEMCFRPLEGGDYVTMSTRINYYPLHHEEETDEWKRLRHELEHDILRKIYPIDEIYENVMEYCATMLTGRSGIVNQIFVTFFGGGANGKTLLLALLKKVLGDYATPLDVAVLTCASQSANQHSDGLAKARRARLVYFEETKKRQTIQDDVLKRLTSASTIPVRPIFGSAFEMDVDFAVALFTNHMFDLSNLNDDGIWRRMVQIPHVTRFLKPEERHLADGYDFPEEADPTLLEKERINKYAEVFLSMLVERAFRNRGRVTFGPIIVEAGEEYKKSQNVLARFFCDNVARSANASSRITRTALQSKFREWARMENIHGHKLPSSDEVVEYMKEKFGPMVRNGWRSVEWIVDEEEDDEDEAAAGGPGGDHGGSAAAAPRKSLLRQAIEAEQERRRQRGTRRRPRSVLDAALDSSSLPARKRRATLEYVEEAEAGRASDKDTSSDDDDDHRSQVSESSDAWHNPPGCSSSSSGGGARPRSWAEEGAVAKKRRV